MSLRSPASRFFAGLAQRLMSRARGPVHSYKRINEWVSSASNGWASTDVAARMEAGVRGEDYLELFPFGPAIAEAPAARELIDSLARMNLREALLLDFGCSNGVYRELLASSDATRQWQYVGADVNPLVIESCRRRFPGDRFEVVPENGPLPFPPASVDVVLASGVLECVERPDQLLIEFGRITRSWVVLCRIASRPKKPSALYLQRVRHDWGHEEHAFHLFNDVELEGMFQRAGLEVAWIDKSGDQWIPPDDPVPVKPRQIVLQKVSSRGRAIGQRTQSAPRAPS